MATGFVTLSYAWYWAYFTNKGCAATCDICNQDVHIHSALIKMEEHLLNAHKGDFKIGMDVTSHCTEQNYTTICKYCTQTYQHELTVFGKFICSGKMIQHLINYHEVNEVKAAELDRWQGMNHHISSRLSDRMRKCNKCEKKFGQHFSLYAIVKHLICNHQIDLPTQLIPKG